MTIAAAPRSHKSLLDRGNDAPVGYFFFGANRRSGTTWLTTMLNSHPEVMIKNEGWFLNEHKCSIEQWLDERVFRTWAERPEPKGGWLRDIPVDDAITIVTRAMMEALMREAAARTPWKSISKLKMVGDKTTTYFCTKVEQLHRLFPEARFIHMARDGRDVIVSDMFLKFRYKDFKIPGQDPAIAEAAYRYHVLKEGDPVPLLTPAAVEHLGGTWAQSIAGGARARELYGKRFLEVRYEDLLADPWRVREVFEFLGVAADDATLKPCIERNTFEKQSGGRKPGEGDPTHPSRKGIAGDWRNHFTPETAEAFKKVAGSCLVELGYESNDSWTL